MGSRHVLGGLAFLAVGFGLAVACSNYEPPDVANYGPPNGLNTKTPAAPTSEDAGTTAPPGDGGAAPGDGGSVGTQLACEKAGGTLLDAGPCAVSWKNDIYPNMKTGAAWNCAGSTCHGAPTATAPALTGVDERSFYTTLANYTLTVTSGVGVGQPYFNPCSTDPTKSEFTCNLLPTGQCGIGSMPLGAPIADAGAIATWVACGAPEN